MRRTTMLLLVGALAAVAIAPSAPAPPSMPREALLDTVSAPDGVTGERTLVAALAADLGVEIRSLRACDTTSSVEGPPAVNDSLETFTNFHKRHIERSAAIGRHTASCHRPSRDRSVTGNPARSSRSPLLRLADVTRDRRADVS